MENHHPSNNNTNNYNHHYNNSNNNNNNAWTKMKKEGRRDMKNVVSWWVIHSPTLLSFFPKQQCFSNSSNYCILGVFQTSVLSTITTAELALLLRKARIKELCCVLTLPQLHYKRGISTVQILIQIEIQPPQQQPRDQLTGMPLPNRRRTTPIQRAIIKTRVCCLNLLHFRTLGTMITTIITIRA